MGGLREVERLGRARKAQMARGAFKRVQGIQWQVHTHGISVRRQALIFLYLVSLRLSLPVVHEEKD
ncbi:hypothetical protein [Mycetohabitans sp. B46]|uniref:hypothetical protein n=1 Tax=Mycetohabitans sp. B46 TaxID=2772536 RepID=UPI00309D368B